MQEVKSRRFKPCLRILVDSDSDPGSLRIEMSYRNTIPSTFVIHCHIVLPLYMFVGTLAIPSTFVINCHIVLPLYM